MDGVALVDDAVDGDAEGFPLAAFGVVAAGFIDDGAVVGEGDCDGVGIDRGGVVVRADDELFGVDVPRDEVGRGDVFLLVDGAAGHLDDGGDSGDVLFEGGNVWDGRGNGRAEEVSDLGFDVARGVVGEGDGDCVCGVEQAGGGDDAGGGAVGGVAADAGGFESADAIAVEHAGDEIALDGVGVVEGGVGMDGGELGHRDAVAPGVVELGGEGVAPLGLLGVVGAGVERERGCEKYGACDACAARCCERVVRGDH